MIKRTNSGDRLEAGKKALNEEIKSEAGYSCDEICLNTFKDSLDNTFYQYNWVIPSFEDKILCELGQEKYSLNDFAKFCKKRGRLRMQYDRDAPFSQAADDLFEKFISEKTIDYQQDRLEEKYLTIIFANALSGSSSSR
ncbi:MAG: hypothetical protein IIB08_04480 [Bacteroidetes bacterium]|nr:hypothetical protein [Bacteroidota bacterium]